MGRTIRRAAGALAAAALLLALPAAGASAASGTVGVNLTPNPIRLAAQTVNVYGSAEIPAKLYVRASLTDDCTDTPAYSTGNWLTSEYGQPVGPGAFSVDFSYVYGSSSFSNREWICAWLQGADYGQIAFAEAGAPSLRRANATLTVVSPEVERDAESEFTVSGSVEVPRRLDVHKGWCQETLADAQDLPRITPEGGVTVGPGDFSLSFRTGWGSKGEYAGTLCAYLSAPTSALELDKTADTDVEWVPQTVFLRGTQDGARRVALNPTFSWDPAEIQRRWPVSRDVVDVWRIEGRKRIRVLRMTTRGWRTLGRGGRSGTMDDFAYVDGPEIRLMLGFWPGTYEWTVSRKGWRTPPPRRFTIVAPHIRRLRVEVRRDLGNATRYPLVVRMRFMSVPYVTYSLYYRVNGGPIRRVAWDGYTEWTYQYLTGSCARPGGRVEWTAAGWDAYGQRRAARGSFANVSAAHCARLRSLGR